MLACQVFDRAFVSLGIQGSIMNAARLRLRDNLSQLDKEKRLRRLMPQVGLDFSSNDYLGIATSNLLHEDASQLIEAGIGLGSGGSRLLRGNHASHEALEAYVAQLFETEAALFMGGGFQANQAIFSALPGPDDLVLYDELVHASTHEGMRLGKAVTQAFTHNDVDAARDAAINWRKNAAAGQVWIAVEAVYSMDGDFAPIADLGSLARELGAVLVVDEAHATGVFGPMGKGLCAQYQTELAGVELLQLHTCGKALGASGALICGAREMIDILINRGRPLVFATAPSPFNAELVKAALQIAREPELRESLAGRVGYAHQEAKRLGLSIMGSSQIMPIVIGSDEATMLFAKELQAQGFDVRGIRPPTVPVGTSRLRVSITNNAKKQDITALFNAIVCLQEQAA